MKNKKLKINIIKSKAPKKLDAKNELVSVFDLLRNLGRIKKFKVFFKIIGLLWKVVSWIYNNKELLGKVFKAIA